MRGVPSLRSVDDAPAELLSGHLWLLELIDGRPLRFQLQESGLLRIGDDEGVYDDPDAVPLPLQRAVDDIRATLDRTALRAAVDDVTAVTFFGVATTQESVPYVLDSMPPFLGTDVWADADKAFRPPDAAAGIFQRLGLTPVNTFEREVHARDFAIDRYEIPASAWYDGPAAGVVIRNKQGHRARMSHPAASEPTTQTAPGSEPEESIDALVAAYVSSERIDTIAASIDADSESAAVDTLTDELCVTIGRRHPAAFLGADTLDRSALRSAVAERVHQLR
ncbi:MAG: hypothetical protein J07HN4v3_01476 [Halonotius sp. J07HN4]|nr:MAG: hypothetical protein J07HN4v3_01476 [Halonotius sp. J07HN4]